MFGPFLLRNWTTVLVRSLLRGHMLQSVTTAVYSHFTHTQPTHKQDKTNNTSTLTPQTRTQEVDCSLVYRTLENCPLQGGLGTRICWVYWQRVFVGIAQWTVNLTVNYIETLCYLLFISFTCYWNRFWPAPKDVTYISVSRIFLKTVPWFFFALKRLRTSNFLCS